MDQPAGLARREFFSVCDSGFCDFYGGSFMERNSECGDGFGKQNLCGCPSCCGFARCGNSRNLWEVTTDAKGRVTSGAALVEADIPTLSTAGKVSGSAINTGTVGGNAAINTTGNLVTTGTVSGQTLSATGSASL